MEATLAHVRRCFSSHLRAIASMLAYSFKLANHPTTLVAKGNVGGQTNKTHGPIARPSRHFLFFFFAFRLSQFSASTINKAIVKDSHC